MKRKGNSKAKKVVKETKLSPSDFSKLSGIPLNTLQNHRERVPASRIAELFWQLSEEVLKEKPSLFYRVILPNREALPRGRCRRCPQCQQTITRGDRSGRA